MFVMPKSPESATAEIPEETQAGRQDLREQVMPMPVMSEQGHQRQIQAKADTDNRVILGRCLDMRFLAAKGEEIIERVIDH